MLFLRFNVLKGHSDSAAKPVDARAIRADQVGLLFELLPLALVFSALTAGVVVFSLRDVADTSYLTVWAIAYAVVTLARLGLSLAYRRLEPPPERVGRWLWASVAGALIAGSLWGGAVLLLLPGDQAMYQLVIIIATIGMAAGSATTLSPVWPVAVGFLVPTVLPVIAVFQSLSYAGSEAVGAIAALFLVGILITSYRQSRFIRDNIRLHRERAEREAALRESEIRYRLIFQNVPLGILSYDNEGTITECNNELVAIMGSSRDALVGLNLLEDLHDDKVKKAVRDSLNTGSGEYEGDYTSVTGNKTTPLRASFKAVETADGGHSGGVAVVEDFTERRQAAVTIERQANYDALTELANRRLLIDHLESSLENGRVTGQKAGVIFLDLDYFKRINDSMGHAVGDELLTAVASRLNSIMRGGDIAARLSGDEFVALIGNLGSDSTRAEAQLDTIANRIIEQLSAPYYIRGSELYVSPSLGIVVLPRGEETALDVLTYADTAMYRAKSAGRATYRIYRASMQAEVDERLALESDLREALVNGDVEAHYQVIVNRAGAGVGTESLARWYHAERGWVSPGEFIPIAEETGLIVTLGEQMLQRVCQQLASHPADDPLLARVSVNVSPRQFRDPDFAQSVERILDATGCEPSRLILEVTENVLVENLDLAAGIMHRLKARGVRFSIDDFGMGYSSLAYLKRLPLDILKIDQHFVRDVTRDSNDAAIVETIIAMAEHLELTVIAEGVEKQEQFEWLRERGCRFFQGYLFGRPATVDVKASPRLAVVAGNDNPVN
jgi:diguanylate cyclase (GGDEF)-like protein/PAS domain S-box-containing protein